jgi:flavin reductase (DIM6/NTAB) family NADH-FMN oxidoreductase RutF
MVSTISPAGVVNVASFSFFNAVAADLPALLFCPGNRLDGGDKDTLRNVRPAEEGGTGEFVVNVSTEPIARQVAAAAEDLPYGESELDLTGPHHDAQPGGGGAAPGLGAGGIPTTIRMTSSWCSKVASRSSSGTAT